MKLPLLLFLLLSSSLIYAQGAGANSIEKQVSETQSAHHLESWWGKDLVQADVLIDFKGNRVVDGTFLFEAHGPKARYTRKEGATIIFDGETAWVSPSSAEAPMGRFHVLTWPWFIMAPFKMSGEGIKLSELSEISVNGQVYASHLQIFGEEVGDTPDDWYRFFINPETDQIEAMSYIVTYGKDTEKANEQPSIIKYLDYEDEGGPFVSRSYEFWYWESPSVHSTLPFR
jgi:hypothetical protein